MTEPIEVPIGAPSARVRAGYDLVAHEYAAKFSDELAHKPFDCEQLKRFAIEVAGRGPVYDLGCGPGQTTAFLADLGVPVHGLDLSRKLVDEARLRHPGVDFMTGDMLALPVSDAALGGIVAFYSLVHFSEEQRQAVFAGMHRALRKGGRLLLAFHVGEGTVHVDEFLGKPVSADFMFLDPVEVAAELAVAGFAEISYEERPPYPGVEFQSRRAYLSASKYGA